MTSNVRLQSWEDHDPVDASYDAIISIGAFEHFARLGLGSEQKIAIYRRFFGRCHGWLKSRQWMSLQTVAYGNSLQRDFDGFIGQQIFPETDTPRLFEIAAGADRLFEVGGLDLHRITLRKIDSPR